METYASIFAVWFSGGTIIPINPNHPKERQKLILDQVEFTFVVGKNENIPKNISGNRIDTSTVELSNQKLVIAEEDSDRLLYILFTSGSTGIPKGVPITLRNLDSYITNNLTLFPELNEESRSLQIFDLTFDASLQSYVMPMTVGACIYPVSSKKIKYLEASD